MKAFLDGMDSYWFGTQTVAPDDMSAEGISTSAIRLSWENVGRQGSGIYDVYYSLTAGGPYTFYGSVPDRLRNSFDITGLDAGTTYYFVMKSHSYVHPYNKNEVISNYSEEVSAVTLLPEGTYLLDVQSSPYTGIGITVSPDDYSGKGSGTTKFTRCYRDGTEVTLTVPAEYNDQKFDHWKLDGTKIGSGVTVTITISGDHKIKAYYVTPSRPGLVVRPNRINFGYILGEELPPFSPVMPTATGPWVIIPWIRRLMKTGCILFNG